MCVVQSTKIVIKRAMPFILLQKKYEVSIAEVEKKSPPSKVNFGDSTKILCEAWNFTEETNFVCGMGN
jgi:hypothetical protein